MSSAEKWTPNKNQIESESEYRPKRIQDGNAEMKKCSRNLEVSKLPQRMTQNSSCVYAPNPKLAHEIVPSVKCT
jgi:hypothetical protein